MQHYATVFISLLTAAVLVGCASKPEARRTDFLSDYSQLQSTGGDRMAYSSPAIRNYQAYIIDPVQFRIPEDQLSDEQRSEIATHFNEKLSEMLTQRGLTVTRTPGPNVARLRIAITGIAKSTWWLKIHPASKLSGAGTGGAAMEGEVVDSVSGKQVGAVIQASSGSQFNLTHFSTVSDVNSAVDKWVDQAGKRLDELRNAS